MGCFYCGKPVSLIRKRIDADFCCDKHRQKYHERTMRGLSRVLEEHEQFSVSSRKKGPQLVPLPPPKPAALPEPPKGIHGAEPPDHVSVHRTCYPAFHFPMPEVGTMGAPGPADTALYGVEFDREAPLQAFEHQELPAALEWRDAACWELRPISIEAASSRAMSPLRPSEQFFLELPEPDVPSFGISRFAQTNLPDHAILLPGMPRVTGEPSLPVRDATPLNGQMFLQGPYLPVEYTFTSDYAPATELTAGWNGPQVAQCLADASSPLLIEMPQPGGLICGLPLIESAPELGTGIQGVVLSDITVDPFGLGTAALMRMGLPIRPRQAARLWLATAFFEENKPVAQPVFRSESSPRRLEGLEHREQPLPESLDIIRRHRAIKRQFDPNDVRVLEFSGTAERIALRSGRVVREALCLPPSVLPEHRNRAGSNQTELTPEPEVALCHPGPVDLVNTARRSTEGLKLEIGAEVLRQPKLEDRIAVERGIEWETLAATLGRIGFEPVRVGPDWPVWPDLTRSPYQAVPQPDHKNPPLAQRIAQDGPVQLSDPLHLYSRQLVAQDRPVDVPHLGGTAHIPTAGRFGGNRAYPRHPNESSSFRLAQLRKIALTPQDFHANQLFSPMGPRAPQPQLSSSEMVPGWRYQIHPASIAPATRTCAYAPPAEEACEPHSRRIPGDLQPERRYTAPSAGQQLDVNPPDPRNLAAPRRAANGIEFLAPPPSHLVENGLGAPAKQQMINQVLVVGSTAPHHVEITDRLDMLCPAAWTEYPQNPERPAFCSAGSTVSRPDWNSFGATGFEPPVFPVSRAGQPGRMTASPVDLRFTSDLYLGGIPPFRRSLLMAARPVSSQFIDPYNLTCAFAEPATASIVLRVSMLQGVMLPIQNWFELGAGEARGQRQAIKLEEDFNSGLSNWTGGTAQWICDILGVRTGPLALFTPSLEMTDYRMEFLARIENRSVGWAVRAAEPDNYYAYRLSRNGPALRLIRWTVTDGKESQHTDKPVAVELAGTKPCNVLVNVAGQQITTFVEGQVADEFTDDRLSSGGVGFFAEADDRARLYWVKVTYQESQEEEPAPGGPMYASL